MNLKRLVVNYITAMDSSERPGVTTDRVANDLNTNFFDTARAIDEARYTDGDLECTEIRGDERTVTYWRPSR